MGGDGSAEKDKWMLEVNLDDLEQTTGESQYYWLVAVQTARETFNLRNQRDNKSAVMATRCKGEGRYLNTLT